MYMFLTIVFVIIAIYAHEIAGHAFAIKKEGLQIEELSFGLPIGPAIRFPLPKKWNGAKFAIYPFPLGASVSFDERALEKLRYHQLARIYGAGPFASLIFGWLLIIGAGISAIVENSLPWAHFLNDPSVLTSFGGILVLMSTAFLGEKVLGAEKFFLFVAPIFFIGYPLATIIIAHGQFAGPIQILEMMKENATDLTNAFWYAGRLSIGVGAAMCLPFYPLDGAGILRPFVKKFFSEKIRGFQDFGIAVLGLIVIFFLAKEGPIILNMFH